MQKIVNITKNVDISVEGKHIIIVEDILDYMGLKNRYSFEVGTCNDLHPGVQASILLDKKKIGIIGSIMKKTLNISRISIIRAVDKLEKK